MIARYAVTADPDVADPDSAETVLIIDQPKATHNGGWLGFGPDGYLYISSGDGGGGQSNNAQNLDVLLGKMLRIDINCDEFPGDPQRNYGIPPDNPFVGGPGTGEIWAYGLRNPWRCSFDRQTGDLYIGDVGAGGREEINFQPAGSGGGENYGWDCKEGTQCTGEATCECTDGTLVDPIFEYPHAGPPPTAVIGGYVYRGSAIPGLAGAYVFADHSVQIWRLRHDGSEVTELVEIQDELPPTFWVASFGEDASGELYICEVGFTEGIYRIVSACPWDLNDDGTVGVGDLLALFANWGTPGPGDFNNDGVVGVGDMLIMFANWGACP